jgi:DNA-binding NtrC family response regulator
MASYVLVVDDEEINRRAFRRRLESWDYRVKEAENATVALEMMVAEPAAIAIVDIRMPGHDGIWLAQRIRERWSKTAIIIATGADDLESIEKSRSLGAIDYVVKPFDKQLLHRAIEKANNAIEGK